jgi:hypothetical protein
MFTVVLSLAVAELVASSTVGAAVDIVARAATTRAVMRMEVDILKRGIWLRGGKFEMELRMLICNKSELKDRLLKENKD